MGKGYAGVAGISFYKELTEIYSICKSKEEVCGNPSSLILKSR
jgi:hypothetical protein